MTQATMAGECVWITGASSGLGRALALRQASAGRCVVASARRADALRQMSEQASNLAGSIRDVTVDVTDREQVKAAVTRIQTEIAPIGLAVLNAGTHKPVHAREFAAADVRALVELNLMGTVNCLEAVIPRMIERRSGRIAVVASLSGYRGLPSAAGYGATKAALINMAEALKPELERFGVKLQVVNPGFVKTPLTDRNEFRMPFLMDVDAAADALFKGLESDRFEIVFPRRFAYMLKVLRCLPYRFAFAVTRRMVKEG